LAAYEHALHCLLAFQSDKAQQANSIQRLQRAFRLPNPIQNQIQARVECTSGKVFLRQIAQLQLKQLDAHPLYTEAQFASKSNFTAWKDKEKKKLTERIASFDSEIQTKVLKPSLLPAIP